MPWQNTLNVIADMGASVPAAKKQSFSNLPRRLITAAIAIPLVVIATIMGGIWFDALLLLITAGLSIEWADMTRDKLKTSTRFLGAGVILVWVVLISNLPSNPLVYLFYLLCIWATDSAAYFVGKTLKGPKLWPSISPNKTWAGLLGGILGCLAFVILWCGFYNIPDKVGWFLFAPIFALLCQAGDLTISKIKRQLDLKDSGTFFPGHGGIIDRMDAFLYTLPFYYLLIQMAAERGLGLS